MGLSVDEQETIISWSRGDAYAEVYTTDTVMMARLEKKRTQSNDWELTGTESIDGEIVAKSFKVPKKIITLKTNLPPKREMTEEQRAAAIERMKNMRKKNKKQFR